MSAGAIEFFVAKPIGKTKAGEDVYMDWDFYQLLIGLRNRTGTAAEDFIAAAFDRLSGVTVTYFQDDEPVGADPGSYWFDTDDGNAPYRLAENGEWVDASNDATAQAILAASDAQASADGKVTTFYGETIPTAEGVGDLWYKPSTKATTRWDGDSWEPIAGNGALAVLDAASWESHVEDRPDGAVSTQLVATGIAYRSPLDPTSSSDEGSSAKISVAAHTVKVARADGTTKTIDYDSGEILGLAYSTRHYIFAEDPTLSGGTVTYVASANYDDYGANGDYIPVGQRTTVDMGGGGGSGPPLCVWEETYVHAEQQAKALRAGDTLHIMAAGGGVCTGQVESIDRGLQPCVRLITESGIGLTCSRSTNVPVERGGYVHAANCVGERVFVDDWRGFRWEKVEAVVDRGELWVTQVHAGGVCYGAGDEPGRRIFTHNIKWEG